MSRITRSLKKRLEELRNISEELSGSESEDETETSSNIEEQGKAFEDTEVESDRMGQPHLLLTNETNDETDESEDEHNDDQSGESEDEHNNDQSDESEDEHNNDQSDNEGEGMQSRSDGSDDESAGEATSSEESDDEGDWDSDFDEIVWEVGLDGSVWKKHFPESSSVKGKVRVENILRAKPGPTPHAFRSVSDIFSAFRLFVDDDMLDFICDCTTKEAQRNLQNDDWKISRNELLAFISICYARGALGLKNMSVTNIFSRKYGPSVIRESMSRDKFKTIMRYLRFDDKGTRKERLATDKFALISCVWNSFIDNCKKCYNPGVNVTVDEQLFPTKTRCPFTQFMKDKPDKFGVKFYFVVDLDSKYILNGFPYTGSEVSQTGQLAGERVVLQLMEPYFNGGYTVTTDNYFTGLNLAVSLKERNITLVGTVNKQRRWLPETAKLKNPGLPLYESNIYLGPDGTTLTLYQSKRNKSVSILSSLHRTVEITETEKKKPETINYYNQTKFGVDVADQMAKKYSSKAPSRRWPVQIFYNILDLAGINAWIVYQKTTGKKISRLDFLMTLSESIREPYLVSKMDASKRNSKASNRIETVAENNRDSHGIVLRAHNENTAPNTNNKRKHSTEIDDEIQSKRQHCQMKKCRNKSSAKCYGCKKVICGKCTTYEQRWCMGCCHLTK